MILKTKEPFNIMLLLEKIFSFCSIRKHYVTWLRASDKISDERKAERIRDTWSEFYRGEMAVLSHSLWKLKLYVYNGLPQLSDIQCVFLGVLIVCPLTILANWLIGMI